MVVAFVDQPSASYYLMTVLLLQAAVVDNPLFMTTMYNVMYNNCSYIASEMFWSIKSNGHVDRLLYRQMCS